MQSQAKEDKKHLEPPEAERGSRGFTPDRGGPIKPLTQPALGPPEVRKNRFLFL